MVACSFLCPLVKTESVASASIAPGMGGEGDSPIWAINGDVPLDRVWFYGPSALNRVYNFKRVCPGLS